jgi:hypothetical protein
VPNWKTWWCVFLASLLLAYYGTTAGPGGFKLQIPTAAILRGWSCAVARPQIVGLEGHPHRGNGSLLGLVCGIAVDVSSAGESRGPAAP